MSLLSTILLMSYIVNPQIHYWEKAVNDASAAIVAPIMKEANKQQDDRDLITPRIEFKVSFDSYGPNTQAPHNWIHPADQSRWPDTRDGKLYAKIVTRRGATGQDHYAMVGAARGLFQSCSTLSGRMALHKVEKIFESGSIPEIVEADHHDATILSFDIRVRILFGSGSNESTPNPDIFRGVES